MEKKKQINRLIVASLFFVLSLSLAFNYTLYNRGRSYYLQLNATHLDPLGLKTYPISTSQNNEGIRKRVVLLGDSRIAKWPEQVIDGYEIINRGIGAQTSPQVVERYDYHVGPLQPDIVFVQIGINDLKTIPLFPEWKGTIITDLEENILKITEKATSQEATVVLTTIFPTGEVPIERKPFWSEDVELAIIEVNEFISSLDDKKIIVFDAYAILVGENGKIKPEYSYDLLHLNETGYEVMMREFEKLMMDYTTK